MTLGAGDGRPPLCSAEAVGFGAHPAPGMSFLSTRYVPDPTLKHSGHRAYETDVASVLEGLGDEREAGPDRGAHCRGPAAASGGATPAGTGTRSDRSRRGCRRAPRRVRPWSLSFSHFLPLPFRQRTREVLFCPVPGGKTEARSASAPRPRRPRPSSDSRHA